MRVENGASLSEKMTGITMETANHIDENASRLKFHGKMTHEFYHEQEDRIIDAMRRHESLEIDLSEVEEVDLCGLHLIGLLKSVGTIVATSPAVALAANRLISSLQSASLGRAARRERLSA